MKRGNKIVIIPKVPKPPKRKRVEKVPVFWEGVQYPSMLAASKGSGASRYAILMSLRKAQLRMESGIRDPYRRFPKYTRPVWCVDPNSGYVFSFPTIVSAKKFFEISQPTILQWIEKGKLIAWPSHPIMLKTRYPVHKHGFAGRAKKRRPLRAEKIRV